LAEARSQEWLRYGGEEVLEWFGVCWAGWQPALQNRAVAGFRDTDGLEVGGRNSGRAGTVCGQVCVEA